ncbi:AsnC family transcriptional regulator [Candidatus Bathyarchaeota archaeon]|nr:AsnC family transcriptional regulator [Candidatus Bathyarchaeota archaeon]
MEKLLSELDVKVLEALCEVGPRNLSKVARAVGISRKRLQSRIERMQSDSSFFLRMYTDIYHTNIGLRKAVVILQAEPGMEQLLFDCLLVNGFWLYVCRSYGMGEGCTAVYAVPVERCGELEEFLREIKRLGIARNAQIFWSTCFQCGRITSNWFDTCEESWVFPWDDWIKEVQTQTTDLPYTLMEAKSYPILADDIDIKMLMKLENDAATSLSEIAEKVGISRQLAHYHFHNHIVARNLIEGYEIFVMRYRLEQSVMVLFIVEFHNYEKLAKFARSLLDKFFVITMGRILRENAFFVEVFLPVPEFRGFVDTLSKMAKMKLVKSYRYFIQDLRIRRRQTISGEFFKEGSWMYDHEGYMRELQRKASAGPHKSRLQ